MEAMLRRRIRGGLMEHLAQFDHMPPTHHSSPAPDVPRRAFAYPAVFLHCGWRTRGIRVWKRFRSMDDVAGYYDPLAETLAEIRPDTLASINAVSWSSGHSGLDRPYFDAFWPLLQGDKPGVQRYQNRFAVGDFFASPGTTLPEMDRYLRPPITTAEERGEQAVLKFCRSTGRISWMQRHFPEAAHIVVLPNPLARYTSALQQFMQHDNAYFLCMPLLLLALHGSLPMAMCCVRHLQPELPSVMACTTPRAMWAACEASLRCNDPAGWYRALQAFWVITAATIPDDVDLIIDSDRLTSERHYRRQCEIELATLTGRAVKFDDAVGHDETATPQAFGLRCSVVLDAHRRAEAFLSEHRGAHWADTPVLGHVGLMLAEASFRALCGGAVRPPPRCNGCVAHDADSDIDVMSLSAIGRAAEAERELRTIHASHSWRVTASLRWFREHIRSEDPLTLGSAFLGESPIAASAVTRNSRMKSMRRFTFLIIALLSVMAIMRANAAQAQSLAGTWTITSNAKNACPGQLKISSVGFQSGSYTGVATFQCGSEPAVTERFDIVAAQGIVTMNGHDTSSAWCTDNYSLNLQGGRAMVGTSKDGCGATGTVSLAKTH